MLSTDFVYFISFAVFAFLAFKIVKKHAVPFLDEGIADLSKTIQNVTKQKETALQELNDIKAKLMEFEHSVTTREKHVHDKVDFLMQKHQEMLNALIEKREQAFFERITYERFLKMHALKKEVLDAVIAKILETLQNDPKVAQAFNEKSITLLKEELVESA